MAAVVQKSLAVSRASWMGVVEYSVWQLKKSRLFWEDNDMHTDQMISQMLERSQWLWPQDFDFVQSVSQHLQKGSALSERQAKTIQKIYQRFCENQRPHIFGGGAPGTGKRR